MSFLSDKQLAIPKGSLVLVTGVNGLIGSHVANELLQYGYNVRGTVRNVPKNSWIADLFGKQYGQDRFTLQSLVDMTIPEAFDDIMSDVAAVIHVASPLNWGDSSISMITNTVAAAMNALRAANKQHSVKRFVLTSSSVAAVAPKPDVEGIVVTESSWNNEAVALAQELQYHSLTQAWSVYAASKTRAEQAVWEFYHQDQTCRPDLMVNTVLPSTNFGRSLDPVNQGHPSTSSFLQSLWNGTDLERLRNIPPQYFVDVQDTAKLHIAAAILPGVQGERIFAWAETWNFDTLLGILKHQNEGRSFVDKFQSARDLSVIEKPRSRAIQLLQVLGKSGFTSLEESVRMNTQDLKDLDKRNLTLLDDNNTMDTQES